MQLNPEILKYLTALKEPIAEAMGEWQVGDRGYDPNYGQGFVSKVDDAFIYFTFPDYTGDDDTCYDPAIIKDFVTRIPTALDFGPAGSPSKRCLVGMLKGTSTQIATGILGGTIQKNWVCSRYVYNYGPKHSIAANPYLATLRALAAQEGVEV